MKHTLVELLDIVYRYYPRGIGITDDIDIQARMATEEHARLVAARRQAATDERWHSMLRRIADRFPGMLQNHSIHLPTGGYDACFSFTIDLPSDIGGRTLWFHTSFLAPYYIAHSYSTVEHVRYPESFSVIYHGIPFYMRRGAASAELIPNIADLRSKSVTVKEKHVTFDLTPSERPSAEWITREIETTFDCEPMPPELGTVIVPGLTVDAEHVPKVRLYDCLFSDQHRWVSLPPSEVRAPGVKVEASHLAKPFLAVLTVLAALYQILWSLMPEAQGAFYGAVRTDGILRKEEVIKMLATIRPLIESPVTPRGIAARHELEAATREVEALIAAWDGEGAPPDALVSWASGFLASWTVPERS